MSNIEERAYSYLQAELPGVLEGDITLNGVRLSEDGSEIIAMGNVHNIDAVNEQVSHALFSPNGLGLHERVLSRYVSGTDVPRYGTGYGDSWYVENICQETVAFNSLYLRGAVLDSVKLKGRASLAGEVLKREDGTILCAYKNFLDNQNGRLPEDDRAAHFQPAENCRVVFNRGRSGPLSGHGAIMSSAMVASQVKSLDGKLIKTFSLCVSDE